jgi:uncharacterized protein YndB with AHSA1/START domain
MRAVAIASSLALVFTAPAHGAVKSAAPNGFQVEQSVVVPVPPERAFAALGQVQLWWDSAHTYSGNSSNLKIDLNAGGCFCERIPSDGGSVEHGRVVYSRPGAALRLHGSLGPLQSEAVNGTLTWTFERVAAGTEVTQSYVVGGYFRGGAEALAPLVDQVMSTQIMRYRDYVARHP